MNLLTGATGLLGSHIAEALIARGERVRALVRPGSVVAFLRQLGAELVEGDLLRPASLPTAVAGADIVYHCAARVGNWGTRKEFRTDIVDTTRNLLQACAAAGVGRVLYVSSLSVYGHPPEPQNGLMTEDELFCQRLGIFDYYCRAKADAERLAREYGRDITIVRPSWIYGPRDRNGFPRLVHALRDRWVSIVGSGDNPLNIVYAADVADGAIRAANCSQASGRVYHLASEGEITQKQFFDILTDGLGLPRIQKHVSPRLAWFAGLLGELIARGLRWRRSPHVTCYGMSLLTRSTKFSIARAKSELGWQPHVNPQEGLQRTLDWFLRKQSV
jgi:nucleoside-diphosphate-sugar epimerase